MTSISWLQQHLSENYTRDPSFRIWNTSAVNRALNKWYTQVQNDLWYNDWTNETTWTITLVSWTETYDLPTWFVALELAKYDGTPLYKTTRAELEERNWNLNAEWTPSRYYLFWNQIGFYPTPNISWSVEIQYTKSLTTLDADNWSLLPDICDDAICLYASYSLFLWVRDSNSASLFLQDYEKSMNTLRKTLLFDDTSMTFTTQRENATQKRPLEI